jgi:MarR family transcriptional regulator, 2-MHQ and catechol-resistance regulon repressor
MPASASDATPHVRPDTQDFHQALTGLLRVYQFRDRDRICCHDISVTQCYALEALVQRGPQTLNELAAELYLDKSTASRVVDALQAKGYAERRSHPSSGRSVLVAVTGAGRALHALIERDILQEEQHLLDEFPPGARRQMTELIRSLARAAASRVDARGGSCCSIDPCNNGK